MPLNNNYFIFGNCCDYCSYMVHDSLGDKNVRFYNRKEPIRNKVLLFLYKVSYRLKLPFRHVCYKYFFDYRLAMKNKSSKNIFIFYDSHPLTCNTEFLEFLRKKIKNSVLIIYFSNSLSLRNFNDTLYFKKYFDKIFTCDRKDAEDNGFIFKPDFYSLLENQDSNPEYDLFFVGAAKGREQLLLKAYNLAISAGLKVNFNIIGSTIPLPDEIHTDRLSYKKVVSNINNSRAILDIDKNDATYATLRYCEAIVYNKFLITNNKTYRAMPYFNTGNIRIIDIEHASKDDFGIPNNPINYGYDGDFSFLNFLKMLDNECK